MLKLLKWLFGYDDVVSLTKVKTIYLCRYDDRYSDKINLLRRVNTLYRPLGYRVDLDDLMVVRDQEIIGAIGFGVQAGFEELLAKITLHCTDNHVIIMHDGTSTRNWHLIGNLETLLIKRLNKQTVCKIGFDHHHQKVCAYLTGKSDLVLVDNDIDILVGGETLELFKKQMLEGIVSH